MASIFKNLKPSLLWKHFEEILKIPHCSGNETAIGDYVISVAKKNNLKWKRDKVGNIVVSKPASPEKKKGKTIIIQGHLDMVCEKNSDVKHDFTKDAIKVIKKDKWIQAQGTTLGADNGIGLCSALAILDDKSLSHGPIECLFTVDEETGLTGATQIKSDFLKGKILLNVDSEDEGTFTIGCAGGADNEIVLPVKRQKKRDKELYKVKLFGLRGGHSGIDIDQGRGNAIQLLSRILWQTTKKVPFFLTSIDGGSKRNAIPREAWATCLIDRSDSRKFSSSIRKFFKNIKNEFQAIEKNVDIEIKKAESNSFSPLTPESQKNLVNLLFSLPHGVVSMHSEIKDLVETSNNLAIVKTHEKNVEIVCSSRSSVASAIDAIRHRIAALCELANAKVKQPQGYPGWTPNLQSSLLASMKDIYQKQFHKKAKIEAIHAGLECGIIGEKFPGMDMISFGPTIQHPHSPDERVNIPSVEKYWKFLTAILKNLS